MKTIEVTDKAAKAIERLRAEDEFELIQVRGMLCNAFSALVDIATYYPEHDISGAQIMLSEYHKLITELSQSED